MSGKNICFIDLFAGASGLAEGFIHAGYAPIAHIEMNADACNTIRTRSAYHYLHAKGEDSIYADYLLGTISRDKLYSQVPTEVVSSVINKEITNDSIDSIFSQTYDLLKGRSPDIIIGGPPCQAYSLLGRHLKEMEDDPRTLLYLLYGRFLKEFSPKAFVFENVPGLLSAKKGEHFANLQKYFRELGYHVHFEMLDAADFGVVQNRKRLILVGWQNKIDHGFPKITRCPVPITVNELFQDLPVLFAGETRSISEYRTCPNPYLLQCGLRGKFAFLSQCITRPVNESDARIYQYVIEKWDKDRIRVGFPDIPEGMRTQKNVSSFVDRFKVVNGNGVSHTIIAHLAKDGHYYIHPDINQCRSISVREAARLQSFPDDFFFEGSRSAIFKQIGNAVPPLFAYRIAQSLKPLLYE